MSDATKLERYIVTAYESGTIDHVNAGYVASAVFLEAQAGNKNSQRVLDMWYTLLDFLELE